MSKIRVLELYCGIGGMHWALKMTGVPFEIVAAMEINPTVLSTYVHNFPNDNAFNRNIQSLTSEELNEMEIDLITMSPPCQPFCRTGLKLDVQDHRTDSFQQILKILPDVQFRYILLENVKGFEESEAHDLLIETLKKCNFHWQEFLLTPTTLGIPNSRLRYYMIGKREDISWCFQRTGTSILTTVPMSNLPNDEVPYGNIMGAENRIWTSRREKLLKIRAKIANDGDTVSENHPQPELPVGRCVGDILENLEEPEKNSEYYLKPNVIEKYGQAMDIVRMASVQTCCFTKSYGHYVKGTGSILDQSEFINLSDKNLRFFTPREIARLLCYPDDFEFPSSLSFKQKSRALGNSINVYVVSILMALLLKD